MRSVTEPKIVGADRITVKTQSSPPTSRTNWLGSPELRSSVYFGLAGRGYL